MLMPRMGNGPKRNSMALYADGGAMSSKPYASGVLYQPNE